MSIKKMLRITHSPLDAKSALKDVIPAISGGININTSRGDLSLHEEDATLVMELVAQIANRRASLNSFVADQERTKEQTILVPESKIDVANSLKISSSQVQRTPVEYYGTVSSPFISERDLQSVRQMGIEVGGKDFDRNQPSYSIKVSEEALPFISAIRANSASDLRFDIHPRYVDSSVWLRDVVEINTDELEGELAFHKFYCTTSDCTGANEFNVRINAINEITSKIRETTTEHGAPTLKVTNAATGEVSTLVLNESLKIGESFRLIGNTQEFRAVELSDILGDPSVTGISACGGFKTTARVCDTAKFDIAKDSEHSFVTKHPDALTIPALKWAVAKSENQLIDDKDIFTGLDANEVAKIMNREQICLVNPTFSNYFDTEYPWLAIKVVGSKEHYGSGNDFQEAAMRCYLASRMDLVEVPASLMENAATIPHKPAPPTTVAQVPAVSRTTNNLDM